MDAKPQSDVPAHTRLTIPLEFASPLPTGAAKKAVDILGRRIVNDAYPPDTIMPTEAELAQSLGVSRATVRDAVKVLSGKGLVRTARRYGTRVRAVEEWSLLDSDVVSWHAPDHPRIKRMFGETTELRTIIEPAAAALAAIRATAAQIEVISEAAQAMDPGQGDVQTLFSADCRFHVTLLDATHNDVMRQLAQIIVTMLRISYEFGVLQIDDKGVSREGHIAVANAIEARDPAGAEAAMTKMLDQNRRIASGAWAKR
ncbi:FadR/GntR family transcriptional regulator [Acuticoccus sp. MNP-M23]|uniref:FadR/GntR family transcriptional regulator n=1 Tax=Acuticoccus sp. MNP-M23 TaxID=3072793 RepID=UPI00281674CA|nr:FadR/GntR family transcriptional regulator [Acuticoccus sp. MNP-M23]WMS40948.1 FadR/GntR family transcriptional regulator [Acuticoccus sp. MNP-M23]